MKIDIFLITGVIFLFGCLYHVMLGMLYLALCARIKKIPNIVQALKLLAAITAAIMLVHRVIMPRVVI